MPFEHSERLKTPEVHGGRLKPFDFSLGPAWGRPSSCATVTGARFRVTPPGHHSGLGRVMHLPIQHTPRPYAPTNPV